LEHEEHEQHREQPVSDELEINFHVLGALVLNWVGGEADNTDVIAVDEAGGL
jgi:hypothetical protein